MSLLEDIPRPDNGFYALVTGANSGLGLGIGARLIDEFLQTRPQSESLVLIITTRDKAKGDATIETLRAHLQKVCRRAEQTIPGITMVLQRRVYFRQERLDLLSLVSVQKLTKRLRETTPRLDAVMCNAGIGGWTGINWPRAIWDLLTGWKQNTTYPQFKIASVGGMTKPQIPNAEDASNRLGEVFCANFFGHYLLGHYLAPLLERHDSEQTKGRLIWTSSLEAYTHAFDIGDIQGLQVKQAYEASKRLTDLMAITSALPPTEYLVNQYLEQPSTPQKTRARVYLTHPGVCGTSIVPLPYMLQLLMFAAFYITRWLGSQWHNVTVEKGACAIVWIALAKQSTLDSMEAREGVGKWGSATDVWGQERVERTEVEGWGYGGRADEMIRKGRSPYAKDATEESRKRFVEEGVRCWEEMEKLRVEWERRLKEAGVGVELE